MNLLRIAILGLACTLPVIASAQWQWIDKDGRKIFSDRAPPPDIPEKSILKQPGGSRNAAAATSAAAAPVDVAATPPRPTASALKITGKDKDLEEKKKQADAEMAAKKKAEDDRLARQRSENCDRMRQAKATYDSGMRIARTNTNGEREILDDAARAAEAKRLNESLANDCKS